MINALNDYTAVYTKGCTPPSSTSWKDPDNNVAFHNKTTVMTHNATISIAAKWLDDMNNTTSTQEQRDLGKKNYYEVIGTSGSFVLYYFLFGRGHRFFSDGLEGNFGLTEKIFFYNAFHITGLNKVFHQTVFEGMVTQYHQSPARFEQVGRTVQ